MLSSVSDRVKEGHTKTLTLQKKNLKTLKIMDENSETSGRESSSIDFEELDESCFCEVYYKRVTSLLENQKSQLEAILEAQKKTNSIMVEGAKKIHAMLKDFMKDNQTSNNENK